MSKIKDALIRAKQEHNRGNDIALFKRPIVSEDMPAKTKVVPYSETAVAKNKIITPYFDNPELTNQLKFLRTKILQETQEPDYRTIMVTSSVPGEGKTFLAVNLAITFAREVDQTVLLVDVHFQHACVARVFGIDQDTGLSDYLLRDVPLSELLVRPGIEKLTLLPAGQPVENSAELLRSQKMRQLIREMKDRYADRYIFFDAPPILASVDGIVLSDCIDKVLFVVASGQVKPAQVTEALSRLDKEKLLGTIINKKIS